MSKEEILKRLSDLEREADEIRAEQANLDHLLTLVNGGRLDATMSHVQRIQGSINARIARWNRECDRLDREVRKLAA